MKVGDLVEIEKWCKNKFRLWCYRPHGTHFTVAGCDPNQVFNSASWELLNESR